MARKRFLDKKAILGTLGVAVVLVLIMYAISLINEYISINVVRFIIDIALLLGASSFIYEVLVRED